MAHYNYKIGAELDSFRWAECGRRGTGAHDSFTIQFGLRRNNAFLLRVQLRGGSARCTGTLRSRR
jgi:hypothetical protein